MSGNGFSYNIKDIDLISGELAEIVEKNIYNQEVTNILKETHSTLNKLVKTIHDIDYLLAGDISEETFLEYRNENT